MMYRKIIRILAIPIIFLSAIFTPWWFATLILVVFFFAFDAFYEGVFAALILDLLYGPPSPETWVLFPFTFSALALVLCLPLLKRRMIFWSARRF